MKDKHQRKEAALPYVYAALYDHTIAASLFQGAANSMAYAYPPNPMMSSARPYTHGYRCAPYTIPPRSHPTGIPTFVQQPQFHTMPLDIHHPAYAPHVFRTDYQSDLQIQSSTSPLSSLSVSSTGSDEVPTPLINHLSMPSVEVDNFRNYNINSSYETTLLKARKPKLFKPYTSED